MFSIPNTFLDKYHIAIFFIKKEKIWIPWAIKQKNIHEIRLFIPNSTPPSIKCSFTIKPLASSNISTVSFKAFWILTDPLYAVSFKVPVSPLIYHKIWSVQITRQNFTIAEMATSCSHTKLYTLQFTWLSSVQINLQHYGFLRAQILSVSAQKLF